MFFWFIFGIIWRVFSGGFCGCFAICYCYYNNELIRRLSIFIWYQVNSPIWQQLFYPSDKLWKRNWMVVMSIKCCILIKSYLNPGEIHIWKILRSPAVVKFPSSNIIPINYMKFVNPNLSIAIQTICRSSFCAIKFNWLTQIFPTDVCMLSIQAEHLETFTNPSTNIFVEHVCSNVLEVTIIYLYNPTHHTVMG